MPDFQIIDPEFEARVRKSFTAQRLMSTIGAEIMTVEPGSVTIGMSYREDLTQQDGFLHAGITTALGDTACGYAASTLMARETAVLSVEFKVNLLSPALGERFVAHGRVLRAGRTLTVCQGELIAHYNGTEKMVATMLATMITIKNPTK